MTVCQATYLLLIHRYREQAPSHIRTVFTARLSGVSMTSAGTQQFAVILAALLWSQYEFVADR